MRFDALLVVAGVWASIAGLRAVLQRSPALRHVAEQAGISVTRSQIRWHWPNATRLFATFARRWPRFFRGWFAVGAVFGVVTLVLSVAALLYTLVGSVSTLKAMVAGVGDERSGAAGNAAILTPVIPGVNLPLSEMGYYFVALVLATVVHEMGHGIAAMCEGVPVRGFGVILYVVYPGAYVDLPGEELGKAPLARQLRIYCAGVWHNFVLSLLCGALLLCLPGVLAVLYSRPGDAVVVSHVSATSPLAGALSVGAHIMSVDDCVVATPDDWPRCLGESIANRSAVRGGFCVPQAMLDAVPPGAPNCCDASSPDALSSTLLCFEDRATITEACLPARQASGHIPCTQTSDCRAAKDVDDDLAEHVASRCMYPRSAFAYERFVRIAVRDEPVVLYIGDPRILYHTVTVSPYAPRTSFAPRWLPETLERLCLYTISLSGALALLNVVPAFLLDGQWIVFTLIDMFMPSAWSYERRKRIARTALYAGTALLGATIVVSFAALLVQ